MICHFTDTEVNKTNISGHNIIEVTTKYNVALDDDKHNIAKGDTNELSNMNFYSDKILWNEINDLIPNTHWNTIFKNSNVNINTTLFRKRLKSNG